MIGVFDMQLTQKLAKEYKKASKKRKGEMLTEYCLLTEVSRNTSSKRFCKEIRDVYPRVLPKTTKYRKRGPRNKFNSIHKEIVRRCWELGGNICAERLHPMLTPYIDQLDIRGMLKFYSKEDIAQTRIFHRVFHYQPDNDRSILKVLFERMKSNNKVKKHSFTLSRSRPYKKNDNAHVEQKNDDKVRKLVGYYRYDTPQETDLLNKLYEKTDLLDNFFIPSSKLIHKLRDNSGRVIRRVHDKPKTPFQRLMECKELVEHDKQQIKKIFKSLDMIELRQEVNKILQILYDIQLMRSRRKNMI